MATNFYFDSSCLQIKVKDDSTNNNSSGKVDNNHCSVCQFHNMPWECLNYETFAGMKNAKNELLRGPKVSQNEVDIQFNKTKQNTTATDGYSAITVTKDVSKIESRIWTATRNILRYIKEYGEKGTRNPTTEKINAVTASQYNKIYLDDYNTMLSALDKNIIDKNKLNDPYPIINAQLIDNLQSYIKNYQLNNDRCNTCNISCENCQTGQCDSPATGGGGGGGDYQCYRENGNGGYGPPA